MHGKEIAFPFHIDSNGLVATVHNRGDILQGHLRQLFGTQPGERVMLPEYGVPLWDYVFEPDVALVMQRLHADISDALKDYEPELELVSLEPVSNSDTDGIVGFNVNYRFTEDDNTVGVNTAFISTAGTVTEIRK